MRGLAALAVCVGHLRAVMMEDFSRLTQHTGLFDKAFYLVSGIGHQAVIVFFVLSGYLVGGSVLARWPDFDWRIYAIARLSRLWTVLVPALLLTLVVDLAFVFFSPEIVSGQNYACWQLGAKPDGSWSISPLRFGSNLLFLQTVSTPVFGSNSPLWSLANEFWYYLLFPAGMIVLRKALPWKNRLAAAALVLLLSLWLPGQLLALMSVWLLGAGVWMLSRRPLPAVLEKTLLVAGVAAIIGMIVMIKHPAKPIPPGYLRDLLTGLAFALLLIPFGRPRSAGVSLVTQTCAATGRWLSDISYSLYLTHVPLMLAANVFLMNKAQFVPSAATYALFFAILATILLFAWGFWFLFESRTSSIRKWMTNLTAPRAAAP